MLAFNNETPKMEATLIYIETLETGGVIFTMYIHTEGSGRINLAEDGDK
jgi:hypothetical protein